MNLRARWHVAVLALAVAAAWPAGAGSRQDYARQWPLTLQEADAGAYRVTLDREVYRSAHLPSLRDVEVFNADGRPVPSALLPAGQPAAQAAETVELPWFPLPPGEAAGADDIAVISERDADGRVRRVVARVDGAAPAQARPANAWLLDAGAVDGRVTALRLEWRPSPEPIEVAYRVEGSDDLRDWRTLQPRAQLLDLVRDGQRLRLQRIPLEGSAKYLRLLPLRADAALPLAGVRAELARPAAAPGLRWESLPGRAVVEQGVTHYDFVLEGRFPVTRADVDTAGNDARQWALSSRDREDAAWRLRAGPWVAFQVGDAGAGQRSPAQDLGVATRDRYWRLSSRSPAAAAPTLRLGYQPETIVFLAQGRPPYALAAGSARVTRAEAPLPQLVDALRAQRGADWQPAAAYTGPGQALAGPAALAPPTPERDWKTWLLWGLLVAGAGVVAGFAISLLRRPAGTP